MADTVRLTVGPTPAGDKTIALVTKGGHPQMPGSGECVVLTVEDVTGWSRKRLKQWFARMLVEQPWERRQ